MTARKRTQRRAAGQEGPPAARVECVECVECVVVEHARVYGQVGGCTETEHVLLAYATAPHVQGKGGTRMKLVDSVANRVVLYVQRGAFHALDKSRCPAFRDVIATNVQNIQRPKHAIRKRHRAVVAKIVVWHDQLT